MTDGQLYFLAAAIIAATTWGKDARYVAVLTLIILSNCAGGVKSAERTPAVVEIGRAHV